MAAPITWRNVNNTVTGNPASAFAAASAAFGRAGAGAQNIIENARLDETEQKTALTNRAIQDAFGDGAFTESDLQNLPAGVDFASILESFGAHRRSEAGVGASEASTAFNTARTDNQEFLNTPEQRAERQRRADLGIEIDQANLENAQARTGIARSQETRLRDAARRVDERERGVRETNQIFASEGPEGIRGQARATVDAGIPDIMAAIERRNPGLSPKELAARQQSYMRNQYPSLVAAEQTRLGNDFMQAQIAKYGLTPEDEKQTTFGFDQFTAEQVSSQQRAQTFEDERTLRIQQSARAKVIAKGNKMSGMVPDASTESGWRVAVSQAEADANNLKADDIPRFLEDRFQLDDVDDDDMKKARELLRSLGGNEAAFAQSLEGHVGSNIIADDTFKWTEINAQAALGRQGLKNAAANFDTLSETPTLRTIDSERQAALRGEADANFVQGQDGDAPVDPIPSASEIANALDNGVQGPGRAEALRDLTVLVSGALDSFSSITPDVKQRNLLTVQKLQNSAFRMTSGRVKDRAKAVEQYNRDFEQILLAEAARTTQEEARQQRISDESTLDALLR